MIGQLSAKAANELMKMIEAASDGVSFPVLRFVTSEHLRDLKAAIGEPGWIESAKFDNSRMLTSINEELAVRRTGKSPGPAETKLEVPPAAEGEKPGEIVFDPRRGVLMPGETDGFPWGIAITAVAAGGALWYFFGKRK